jgi:Domain of unknown function (DUF4271)
MAPHRFLIVAWLLLAATRLCALPGPQQYGVVAPSDTLSYAAAYDSFMAMHPMVASHAYVADIEQVRGPVTNTTEFYILAAAFLFLGLVKVSDPKYFSNLWKSFSSPALSGRQLQAQIQDAGLPNLLMNIYFAIAAGLYAGCVFHYMVVYVGGFPGSPGIAALFIPIVGLLYSAKFVAVKFSGWAFDMESVTENYIFNTFLVNKIMALVLLPAAVLIAFTTREVAGVVVLVSFFIVGILFCVRYLRSWSVFGAFFRFSKFHFFLYLCASELLPLAVLVKILTKFFMR